ncbi:protein NEDD1-like [Agrilus planipennis]|uniref:Protein NEDD1-like n=1 Tax=Agrilus planipennis TaxID=224129 RepID=A0A1W4WG15_AGRPL|nr:protein NEDD1-like [Agrilus planipennis]
MLLASCGADAKFHDWPSGKFYGHYQPENSNKIKCVSWSKDGDTVVLVQTMGFGTAVVVSPAPLLQVLDNIQMSRVEAAAFSRVENHEVTLGLDNGGILVYDIKQRTINRVLKTIPACVEFLDYSVNDLYLAAGCSSGQIVLYNNKRRICASYCVPNSYDLSAMSCHPCVEEYLAGASCSGHLAVWDVPTGNSLFTTKSHNGGIMDIAFSKTEDMICTVGLDKKFCIYSLNSGERTALVNLEDQLSSVDFAPNGEQIVVASIDGKILGYDIRNMNTPNRTLIPHTSIYKIKFQQRDTSPRNIPEVEDIQSEKCSSLNVNTFFKDRRSFESISEDSRDGNAYNLDEAVSGGGDAIIKEPVIAINSKPEIKIQIPSVILDRKVADEEISENSCSNTSSTSDDYSFLNNLITQLINHCIENVVETMNNEFMQMKMQLTKEIIYLENRIDEKFKEIVYAAESVSTIHDQEPKPQNTDDYPLEISVRYKKDFLTHLKEASNN